VILPGPDGDGGGPDRDRRRARRASTTTSGPANSAATTSTNGPQRTRRDRRIALRISAAVLGLLALAAGLVTAVAVSASRPSPGVPVLPAAGTPTSGTEYGTRPIRPYPDLPGRTATGATGPTGTAGTSPTDDTGAPGGSVTATPPAPSSTPGTPPESAVPPADSAGGVKAARGRVSDFVAALNDNDPQRANSYLCSDLAGSFGDGMLNGVQPGSMGVGGVSVRGDSGTAYVTYLPTGGGDPARAMFGLVVEHAQWMICNPPS
jgi:hypothetical protein